MGPVGVGPGGANTSEGVLANFFNSLLSKKTGQPGSPGSQIKPSGPTDDCEYLFIFQQCSGSFLVAVKDFETRFSWPIVRIANFR